MKKKAKRVSPLSVKKAKGKVTFARASGSKKLTVNKSTGKVTVKKGTKPGTYKVKVKIKVAGSANYKAVTKILTAKIKVK